VARSVPELMRLREKIGVRGKVADLVVEAVRATVDDDPAAPPPSLLAVLQSPLRYYYFRAFLAAYQSVSQAELLEAVLQFRKITNPNRRLLRCVAGGPRGSGGGARERRKGGGWLRRGGRRRAGALGRCGAASRSEKCRCERGARGVWRGGGG
jgi:hypothetical protein